MVRHNVRARRPRGGSKMGNKRVEVDGITFDSQKEARYYGDLKIRQRAGEVVMFLCQVPFHLPGSTKYIADFLVFLADDTVEIVDVKGHKTDVYKLKKRQVEALYPVSIKEV